MLDALLSCREDSGSCLEALPACTPEGPGCRRCRLARPGGLCAGKCHWFHL